MRPKRVVRRYKLPFRVPRGAQASDVVGIGGEELLGVPLLRAAYRRGIFPWPHEGYPLLWFCPRRRGILEFADLHIGARLQRTRRNTPLTFTINRAFPQVIAACQQIPRKDQGSTWITPGMVRAYTKLHLCGDAHSVEAWEDDDNLVGGLYGVAVRGTGGGFAGESMFALRRDASKLAFLFLVEHLSTRGLTWVDTQMVTPVFASLGGKEIARAEFLEKLRQTRRLGLSLFDVT